MNLKTAIKARRRDIILICSLLIVAVGSLLIWQLTKKDGAKVIVRVEGITVAEYSLYANGTYPLNGGTNTLVIEDGVCWMSEADCPDRICVNMGKVSYNGQTITCLPNKLTVTVVEQDSGIDIAAG